MITELTENSLQSKLLELSKRPALLLDRSLKIIDMNLEARLSRFAFSQGASLAECFYKDFPEKLSGMLNGEFCRNLLSCNGEETAASALSVNGNILLIFDTSGYRMVESDFANELAEPANPNGKRTLHDIVTELRSEQFSPHPLAFFDFSTTARTLVDEIIGQMPRFADRICLECDELQLFGVGEVRDFMLISAAITAVLLSGKEKNPILVKASSKDSLLSLRFVRTGPDVLLSQNEENELRWLKALADGNFWKLERFWDSNGKCGYELLLPAVKSGEEFLVRDAAPEFLRETVSLCFAALLAE